MTFVYFCFKFPGLKLTPADMEEVDTNPSKGKKQYKVSVPLLMDILCTVILTHDSMCSVTGRDLRLGNGEFRNPKGLTFKARLNT